MGGPSWPRAFLLAGVVAVALLPGAARSTSVERLDDEELASRSHRILWGDVVSVRTAWDDAGERIFTHVEVAPRETLKGAPAALVALKLPGGEVGDTAYVIHGMPRFRTGEEVVLHLTDAHARSGVRLPVGLGQGVHRVLRPAHGPALAARDTRDLHLVLPGVAGAQPGARQEEPLDDLLRRIRETVERQARGGPR